MTEASASEGSFAEGRRQEEYSSFTHQIKIDFIIDEVHSKMLPFILILFSIATIALSVKK